MITDLNSPCELILKIGCNECDEISNAIITLLRSCSIDNEKFISLERQIQPTSYFGSFTIQSSILKIPIQSQSLSCVIFLTDELLRDIQIKNLFKPIHLWNFHHKIELLNEYKQSIARQDYYELSQSLPLWSVSHIPYNKQIIVRFNIFTKNFQSMLIFYQDLFQRKPDSSKSGFVLFNLSSSKIIYQLSIKYSPSIESYSISQSAYFKFRLTNLNHFIHEYTSKLFTINKSEYYIYDPDGNLLHLCLHNLSSTINELIASKPFIQTIDSGFGDSSSDPSGRLIHPPIESSIDDQNHSSSNDSGQYSSISSREPIPSVNNISVRSARKCEIDYRLKQQQKPVRQKSLYESEPHLSNTFSTNNRYYSSMTSIQRLKTSSSLMNNDISYEVDSPRSTYGYLNAFLLKKQQQQQIPISTSRPKSVPISDSLPSTLSFRPKSTTFALQNSTHDIEKSINQISNSRINIGITLDSRLRKTPVFDMLRSTMMETQHSNKTYSFPPVARF